MLRKKKGMKDAWMDEWIRDEMNGWTINDEWMKDGWMDGWMKDGLMMDELKVHQWLMKDGWMD
jgi:hypothetical protein